METLKRSTTAGRRGGFSTRPQIPLAQPAGGCCGEPALSSLEQADVVPASCCGEATIATEGTGAQTASACCGEPGATSDAAGTIPGACCGEAGRPVRGRLLVGVHQICDGT